MVLSGKQLVLTTLSSLWFLLVILLGDTFLGIYLYGTFIIFIFVFWGDLVWSKIIFKDYFYILWSLFLIWIFLSLFFTLSIPLSIQAIGFYLTGYLLFSFFASLNKKYLSEDYILLFLALIAIVLFFLNFIFFTFPFLGELLPQDNFIFSTFGHNHFSALLVIMTPVFWYAAFKRGSWWLSLATIASLWLVISFSRISLLLSVIELFVIFLWSRKKYRTSRSFLFLKFVILALIIAGLFFFIGSVKEFGFCKLRLWGNVCKPVSQEPRFFYWLQAGSAIQQKPLTGFGVGTFSLISRRLMQSPKLYSAHTHNHFLQIIAEVGLGGWSYFVSFAMIFIKLASFLKKEKSFSFKKFLVLAIIFGIINACFDFDWQLSGSYFLNLFFLGLFFNESEKSSKTFIEGKFFVVIPSAILFSMSFVFLLSEIFISYGDINQAFSFFPYSDHQVLRFINNNDLSGSNKEKLFKVFKNHPSVVGKFIDKELIESKQAFYRDQLMRISKYAVISNNNFDFYTKTENLTELKKQLGELASLWKTEPELSKQIDYNKLEILAEQILTAADLFYENSDYVKAGNYYQLANQVDRWSISRHDNFLLENVDISTDFLFQLNSIEKESFGDQQTKYALMFLKGIDSNSNNLSLSEKAIFFKKAAALAPWEYYQLLDAFSKQISASLEERCELKADCVLFLEEDLNIALAILDEFSEDWDVAFKQKLINLYQEMAVYMYKNNDFDFTEQFVKHMTKVDENDYLSQSQLGNFYLQMERWSLAKGYFKKCLEHFSKQHNDCQRGFELAIQEKKGDAFFSIAEQINN